MTEGAHHDEQAAAAELARRAAARDPLAWSQLFTAEYGGVYAFVRYRLRGAPEAEDIAAQVFETAYLNAHRFDFRGVPIAAWLIGIARNLVRDHVKKQRRRGYHQEFAETMAPPVSDIAGEIALQNDLAAALVHLTEDQQTVIALRFLLDKSVAETAILMDRSQDAVKNLQRRALAALQRALVGAGYHGGAS